jgi:hypothetical protein
MSTRFGGNEARARFELNGPNGPVELLENDGFRKVDIDEIGDRLAADLAAVCTRWRLIHG